MGQYVVTWEEPFKRVPDRDAYAVGLVVRRDGQDIGLWMPMVTGIAMHTESVWRERHPAALALIGAQRVESAIRSERPAGWQLDARPVTVPASDVERLAESADNLPSGPSDKPVLSFDAE